MINEQSVRLFFQEIKELKNGIAISYKHLSVEDQEKRLTILDNYLSIQTIFHLDAPTKPLQTFKSYNAFRIYFDNRYNTFRIKLGHIANGIYSGLDVKVIFLDNLLDNRLSCNIAYSDE